jgi:TonB family protein
MRFTGINLAASFALSFVACVCPPGAGTQASVRAQEAQTARQAGVVRSPEAARGIELYEQGDFTEAVKALKQATKTRRTDATAWHFLALAYKQLGKEKDARKAMENAVVLRLLQLSPGATGELIKPWNELSREEREARRQKMTGRYREALASVTDYLQLGPTSADFWRQQYEGLSFYVLNAERPEAEKAAFQANDEGLANAQVLSRVEPEYTERARQNGTEGTVVLRGALSHDGTVKHIIALVMLPDGLTEKAIEAMRKVRFTPATKNGRPVSQWVMIEYHFNIY